MFVRIYLCVVESDTIPLIVNFPPELLTRLRDAIASGGYGSAEDLVLTAVENQLSSRGRAVAWKDGTLSLDEYLSGRLTDTSSGRLGRTGLRPSSVTTELARRPDQEVNTTDSPPAYRAQNAPLWGGINRILPVKVILRLLANELEETGGEFLPLDKFQTSSSKLARELGLLLKRLDVEKGRSRGDKLSPGFPTGEQADKSMSRFRFQFVGYVARDDKLTGAAPALRFVNIDGRDSSLIGITPAGLEFAQIENPVIDLDIGSDRPLSEEEVSFYMEHIAEFLPSEHRAVVSVTRWIAEGADRPESLSNRVHTLNPSWSPAHANTMRAGLISRMYELGFVNREPVGHRGISYVLTGKGEKLLGKGD